MLSYNPVDLDDTLSNNKTKKTQQKEIMLNIPGDYTGIMHILLTIKNMKNTEGFVSGGITQLNQFLETYNKKEDD